MEGGDSEFANFTLPTLKVFLEAGILQTVVSNGFTTGNENYKHRHLQTVISNVFTTGDENYKHRHFTDCSFQWVYNRRRKL